MFDLFKLIYTMCVIIAKYGGTKMPSENIIRAAVARNRDGWGFVTSSGVCEKGFGVDNLLKKLKKVKTEESVILHMRLATHGSVCVDNCHPFHDEVSGMWFAHNGILPIESKHNMTDSEICFRERLIPAFNKYGFGTNKFDDVVYREMGASRFAFMYKGEIRLYGNYTQINGVYYSNTHFWPLQRKCYSWDTYLNYTA